MTTLQTTAVDLRGLMRVLGEALYSAPHVALRELVQNAHDAIVRRRIEDAGFVDDGAGIVVDVDVAAGTVAIEDGGAGLTRDEIDTCLATVGTGATRRLREDDSVDAGADKDALIGMFGLGFLTSYVISERTEVWTASYQTPDRAHRFMSKNGEVYTVDDAPLRPVGTRVTLHLRPQHKTLGDPAVLVARLRHYASLLHIPVVVRGHGVITEAPPWRDPARSAASELAFAKRYEPVFDPICTFALDDDVPRTARAEGAADGDDAAADVHGVLWIQDGASYATSDQRRVCVYVRGMLVSDDERDLLPRWAGFVGCALESTTLRPTASRESLQENDAYFRVQRALKERLIAGLVETARTKPATWRRILLRHNEALLGAALADPALWDLLKDELTVPTTEGDRTLGEIIKKSGGTFYVSQSDNPGVEALLLRALKKPVVQGARFGALALCKKSEATGRGKVVILGTADGDGALFEDVAVDAAVHAVYVDVFGRADVDVRAKRFSPASLPFVLLKDREAELKKRLESDEADKRIGKAVLSLVRSFTTTIVRTVPRRLYVNVDNPVVQALVAASPAARAQARALLAPLDVVLAADVDGDVDIEAALAAFNAVVLSLLQSSSSSSSSSPSSSS
jgi:molecular chaperone HtpG